MSSGRRTGLVRAFDPAFALGTVLTVAFYVAVHQPAMQGTVLHLYTTEHAVEYVVIALFFWGVSDVLLKLLAFPREFRALRQHWLPERKGAELPSTAKGLLAGLSARANGLGDSRISRRLTRALGYIVERGSAADYREYLKHLAESDEDETYASYVLVRFVASVSPLLGFLGTVIHFGTALSGVSFDGLASRLPEIVSHMGTAFNTTTVAIGTAMVMAILLFVSERIDRQIDQSVNRYVDHELLHRFSTQDPNVAPLMSSVRSASEEALREIGATLDRQTALWSDALGALFEKFEDHRREDSDGWAAALDALHERHEQYDALRERRHEEFDAAREQRFKQVQSLIETRQESHLAQIMATLERAAAVRDDFAALAKTLDAIAQGEGKLAELQDGLTQNLRALRDTQQFEDAIHELTAAIHLLTARQGKAAPQKAA